MTIKSDYYRITQITLPVVQNAIFAQVGTEQAQSLTHLLLSELNTLVHATPRHRPEETLLLAALDPHLESLRPLLLSNNSFQRSATAQLLILHCVHRGRATSASLLSFLLAESSESSDGDSSNAPNLSARPGVAPTPEISLNPSGGASAGSNP